MQDYISAGFGWKEVAYTLMCCRHVLVFILCDHVVSCGWFVYCLLLVSFNFGLRAGIRGVLGWIQCSVGYSACSNICQQMSVSDLLLNTAALHRLTTFFFKTLRGFAAANSCLMFGNETDRCHRKNIPLPVLFHSRFLSPR